MVLLQAALDHSEAPCRRYPIPVPYETFEGPGREPSAADACNHRVRVESPRRSERLLGCRGRQDDARPPT